MFNREDLIDAYSRADALADGVLVDVTRAARAVGFTLPAAMTATAYEVLGAEDLMQLQRVMGGLRVGAGMADRDADRVELEVCGRDGRWVRVWAVIGPGDDAGAVLTVMLEGED